MKELTITPRLLQRQGIGAATRSGEHLVFTPAPSDHRSLRDGDINGVKNEDYSVKPGPKGGAHLKLKWSNIWNVEYRITRII